MVCKNCGGKLPTGTRVCSFCGEESCLGSAKDVSNITDMEKKMAEILMGGNGDGCGSKEQEERQNPTWWKEDDCGSCGGGLTGTDKDVKYALTIVGLIVGVIVFALIVKGVAG